MLCDKAVGFAINRLYCAQCIPISLSLFAFAKHHFKFPCFVAALLVEMRCGNTGNSKAGLNTSCFV